MKSTMGIAGLTLMMTVHAGSVAAQEATPATPPPAPTENATPIPEPAPAMPPAAPTVTGSAPAAKPAAPAAKPGAPSALTVSKDGTFKPGLLLQAWYAWNKAATTSNAFRVRRAEMSAKGAIIPNFFSYGLMFDVARLLEFQDAKLSVSPSMEKGTVTAKQPAGASSVLQDVFITFNTAYVDASIGQFKNPVSWEAYNSTSKLLFPERPLVSGRYGDKRDLGIRLAKQFDFVGYSAGVFNGTGLNAKDADTSKDGALRLEVYPVKGLTVAGVVYATMWDRGKPGAKDRYEADLRFEHGPFLFQNEYIYARDVNKDSVRIRAHGFYSAAAVEVLPKLQVAARVGYLNPDKSKLDDHTWAYEGTVNYALRGYDARLQLAYSQFHLAGPAKAKEHALIFATQAAF